jgi:riboflavin synthase
MFTGIIEEVGTIRRVANLGGGRRLTIEAAFAPELRVDQSVAVNGACQTVVAVEGRTFDVVAVEETLRKTTLGAFQAGQPVNLERAMLPTSRLDGHLVQGHVDATAAVTAVEVLETSRLFRIRFDARFAPYVIPVGSIALDGVSPGHLVFEFTRAPRPRVDAIAGAFGHAHRPPKRGNRDRG